MPGCRDVDRNLIKGGQAASLAAIPETRSYTTCGDAAASRVSMPDDKVREVSKKILERIRGDQQTVDALLDEAMRVS